MKVYVKDGKICIPESLNKRNQNDTSYFFIFKDSSIARVTPLLHMEECISVNDDTYIVGSMWTSTHSTLTVAVYKYANGKLTLLAKLANPTKDELKDSVKELIQLDDHRAETLVSEVMI